MPCVRPGRSSTDRPVRRTTSRLILRARERRRAAACGRPCMRPRRESSVPPHAPACFRRGRRCISPYRRAEWRRGEPVRDHAQEHGQGDGCEHARSASDPVSESKAITANTTDARPRGPNQPMNATVVTGEPCADQGDRHGNHAHHGEGEDREDAPSATSGVERRHHHRAEEEPDDEGEELAALGVELERRRLLRRTLAPRSRTRARRRTRR